MSPFSSSSGLSVSRRHLTDLISGHPCLSAQDAGNCEGPITPEEVIGVMEDCSAVPYELRAEWVYSKICAPELATLVRKDTKKGNSLDNFRPSTLLNTNLKSMAKVLAKRLAYVVDGLVEEVRTCAIPGRTI